MENENNSEKVIYTNALELNDCDWCDACAFYPITEREDGVAANLGFTRSDMNNIAKVRQWVVSNEFVDSIRINLKKDQVKLTEGSSWNAGIEPEHWYLRISKGDYATLLGYTTDNDENCWVSWSVYLDRDTVEGFAYAGTDLRYETIGFTELVSPLPDNCLKVIEVTDNAGNELVWREWCRNLHVDGNLPADSVLNVKYISTDRIQDL